MCYIACDICNQSLMDLFDSGTFDDHVCKKEDIRQHIENLKEQRREASCSLWRIQNNTELFLSNLAKNQPNQTEFIVTKEMLQELWNSVELNTVSADNVESFLGQWLGLHCILVLTFRILSKDRSRNVKFELEKLLEKCKEVAEEFEYDKDWKTVEELVKEIKEDK